MKLSCAKQALSYAATCSCFLFVLHLATLLEFTWKYKSLPCRPFVNNRITWNKFPM